MVSKAGKERGAQKKQDERPPYLDEARTATNNFCQHISLTRVAPTSKELEDFWSQCILLKPAAVAHGLAEQLSYETSDYAWQPRLRVLWALEYFHARGVFGKEVVDQVRASSLPLLTHLSTDVPQCKEKALKVLAVMRGEATAKPPALLQRDAAGSMARGNDMKEGIQEQQMIPEGAAPESERHDQKGTNAAKVALIPEEAAPESETQDQKGITAAKVALDTCDTSNEAAEKVKD